MDLCASYPAALRACCSVSLRIACPIRPLPTTLAHRFCPSCLAIEEHAQGTEAEGGRGAGRTQGDASDRCALFLSFAFSLSLSLSPPPPSLAHWAQCSSSCVTGQSARAQPHVAWSSEQRALRAVAVGRRRIGRANSSHSLICHLRVSGVH
jgi:hypothetical protein